MARKCGICREEGHTRKACPQAKSVAPAASKPKKIKKKSKVKANIKKPKSIVKKKKKVSNNFVQRYLNGEVYASDLEAEIKKWESGDDFSPDGTPIRMAEFLGFTDDEFNAWVELRDCLKIVLKGRKKKKS